MLLNIFNVMSFEPLFKLLRVLRCKMNGGAIVF